MSCVEDRTIATALVNKTATERVSEFGAYYVDIEDPTEKKLREVSSK